MLKGCHLMSERLVTTAMVSTDQQKFIELAMVQLFIFSNNCMRHNFPVAGTH
jgi:hypothetical protein